MKSPHTKLKYILQTILDFNTKIVDRIPKYIQKALGLWFQKIILNIVLGEQLTECFMFELWC